MYYSVAKALIAFAILLWLQRKKTTGLADGIKSFSKITIYGMYNNLKRSKEEDFILMFENIVPIQRNRSALFMV